MIKLRVRCPAIIARYATGRFKIPMNMNQSSTNTQSLVTHTEQPVSAPEAEAKDLTINFYVVGGIINITMILAYFIWAFGAWKKVDRRKKVSSDSASTSDT